MITCTLCSRKHNEISRKKDNLALPQHHVFHVISVMSCLVTSHHMPHHYCGLYSYLFEKYCKVEFQWKHMEYEESCKLKSHRNSNIHEGSKRVRRRVKHYPLVIYTLSLYELSTFHLGSSHNALER